MTDVAEHLMRLTLNGKLEWGYSRCGTGCIAKVNGIRVRISTSGILWLGGGLQEGALYIADGQTALFSLADSRARERLVAENQELIQRVMEAPQ